MLTPFIFAACASEELKISKTLLNNLSYGNKIRGIFTMQNALADLPRLNPRHIDEVIRNCFNKNSTYEIKAKQLFIRYLVSQ
jgi:hypothetical protein